MDFFRVLGAGFALLLTVLARITYADFSVRVPSPSSICPVKSVQDSILVGSQFPICPLDEIKNFHFAAVIEGDEVSLQKALTMVHKRKHDYVAILFYASWCPFSRTLRPSFSTMASLFPSIPHFAFEESAIRPSILSKYGVHGFPTFFILNSTMRVRYHGSRTLDSLTAFYSDVTGIKKAQVDGVSLDKFGCFSDHQKNSNNDPESCPFSWARSPENLLAQDTYLALATVFVLFRLLYLIFPILRRLSNFAWRRYILNIRLRSLWEHLLVFRNRAVQLFNSVKEPCKRSNLQEGALNAKAWASKSLATVSLGDASTSRVVPVSETN